MDDLSKSELFELSGEYSANENSNFDDIASLDFSNLDIDVNILLHITKLFYA